MNNWKPIKDNTPNPFKEMLDDYVARGAPVDHGIWGFVGLGFVILVGLVIVGFIAGIWSGFGCMLDINCMTWLR